MLAFGIGCGTLIIAGEVLADLGERSMNANPSAPPRFYFVSEVATELRRSEAAVRWLLHTGQLKSGKLGGRTVVSAAELNRFIEDAFAEVP